MESTTSKLQVVNISTPFDGEPLRWEKEVKPQFLAALSMTQRMILDKKIMLPDPSLAPPVPGTTIEFRVDRASYKQALASVGSPLCAKSTQAPKQKKSGDNWEEQLVNFSDDERDDESAGTDNPAGPSNATTTAAATTPVSQQPPPADDGRINLTPKELRELFEYQVKRREQWNKFHELYDRESTAGFRLLTGILSPAMVKLFVNHSNAEQVTFGSLFDVLDFTYTLSDESKTLVIKNARAAELKAVRLEDRTFKEKWNVMVNLARLGEYDIDLHGKGSSALDISEILDKMMKETASSDWAAYLTKGSRYDMCVDLPQKIAILRQYDEKITAERIRHAASTEENGQQMLQLTDRGLIGGHKRGRSRSQEHATQASHNNKKRMRALTNEDTLQCLNCRKPGHRSDSCNAGYCGFCGQNPSQHTSHNCPDRLAKKKRKLNTRSPNHYKGGGGGRGPGGGHNGSNSRRPGNGGGGGHNKNGGKRQVTFMDRLSYNSDTTAGGSDTDNLSFCNDCTSLRTCREPGCHREIHSITNAVLDTGAMRSGTPMGHRSALRSDITAANEGVVLTASGEELKTGNVGDINSFLTGVLEIDGLQETLIAGSALQNNELWVICPPMSQGGGAYVADDRGNIIIVTDQHFRFDINSVGTYRGRMCSLPCIGKCSASSNCAFCSSTAAAPPSSIRALHSRHLPRGPIESLVMYCHDILGHPSKSTMIKIAAECTIKNFPLTAEQIERHFVECVHCISGKMKRAPIPKKSGSLPPTRVGESVQVDTYGDIKPKSVGGNDSLYNFIDRFSSYVFGHFEKVKSNAATIRAVQACKRHYNLYHHELEELTGDADPKFTPQPISDACADQGIRHRFSPPFYHEGVGVIERFHAVLNDRVIALFDAAPYVPRILWAYAVAYIIFCWNCLPNTKTNGASPIELFTGEPPDFHQRPLLPWGCPVEVLDDPNARDWHFGSRTRTAIYIGPSTQSAHSIVVYDPAVHKVLTRRDFRVLKRVPPTFLQQTEQHVSANDVTFEGAADSFLSSTGALSPTTADHHAVLDGDCSAIEAPAEVRPPSSVVASSSPSVSTEGTPSGQALRNPATTDIETSTVRHATDSSTDVSTNFASVQPAKFLISAGW